MKTQRTLFNAQLITAMEEGIIPWQIPWNSDPNAGIPSRPASWELSRKKYFGIDVLLLQSAALQKGFHSKYWARIEEWNAIGYQVNPPGTPVTHHTLYNAEQVTGPGIERFQIKSIPLTPNVLDLNYNIGKRVIESTKAQIKHGGERACYTRPIGKYPYTEGDFITLPPIEQFADPAEYYYAAMHELMHWSEAKLGWNYKKFGDGMSEIVAEIGSSFLMVDLKLPLRQHTNCKNMMPSWIECMKKDENWIFEAATQASKGASYIFSLTSHH